MQVLPHLPDPRLAESHARAIGVPDTESGRLFRETDWSATVLGPVEAWPQSLRTAVSICLNSRFPMFVWWGQLFINIYNDAYAPFLGARHPQAFGRPAQESWQDIWDIVGTQARLVMRDGKPTWNDRVLLVMQRNGYPEETWFTWSYSAIYDDDGRVGGVFCACTEETARVRAEQERDRLVREALDAAQTLRTWFDNAPGFIALLRGPDFVFEMVNQAYYQLVGHRQLEGLPVFDAVPEARHQGYEELLQRVYETGEPFVGRGMRLNLQLQPGVAMAELSIDIVYQPVRDASGTIVGIFVQGHDVSEQVRSVEALKTADRRKDEFLATLAHELRNPLAPIRQAASLARAPGVDAQRRTWALDVIERQSAHMALLLEDLLDVSRISRGYLQLRLQAVELREVVAAAVETAKPLFERKRHLLEVVLPGAPVRLLADPVRLAQVFSNLLSNAAKYTNEGGHVELSALVQDREVVVSVRDDGIGLSPDSRAHIFEMFSQVSPALDRAEGGLGIGLALSRGLVTLHGGRIEGRSAGLGLGSEFSVVLPLHAPAGIAAAQAEPVTVQSAPRRTILIADDNRDARESLGALLEMEGHKVHLAADGQEALRLSERHLPAVAILDIGMPLLNGYEAASRIRSTAWGRHILLIALTGWGQAEDQARSREAGFDHHVTKPLDLAQLQAVIGRNDAVAALG